VPTIFHMKFRRIHACLPTLKHLRPSEHFILVMKTVHPVTVTNIRWFVLLWSGNLSGNSSHRHATVCQLTGATTWQLRRVNFTINSLRRTSGNLWRVVVPRGAVPPDSVVDPQPPLHWGYSGGPNNWPTPTSTPSRTPMKRHHSESDECDDVFSEESSKEQ
jgi:hypothetical protein